MEIVTRKFAIENGLSRFFTGKPCVHGHLSERKTVARTCIACVNARNKLCPKVKERRRNYYLKNREAEIKNSEKWNSENEERVKELRRQYHKLNGKANSAKRKIWADANRERVRSYVKERKARIKSVGGKWAYSDVLAMMAAQQGKCVYCPASIVEFRHVDHIMPLTLGGSNWPDNLQLLCPRCNIRKNNKHPDEWEKQIGFVR